MDKLLSLGLITAAAAVGLALVFAITRGGDPRGCHIRDDPWDPTRWRGDD